MAQKRLNAQELIKRAFEIKKQVSDAFNAWKEKPSNQIGNQLIRNLPINPQQQININRSIETGLGKRTIPTTIAQGFNNYFSAPLFQIPYRLQEATKARKAGDKLGWTSNMAQAGFGLLPGIDDVAFAGYNALKTSAQKRSLSGIQPGLAGMEYAGLGDALTGGKGGSVANTINTLELPLILAAGGLKAYKSGKASKKTALKAIEEAENAKVKLKVKPQSTVGGVDKWYHGSTGGELNFGKAPKGNQLPYGVHLTQDKEIAESFASGATKGKPTGNAGKVYDFNVNIKKPFDVSTSGLYREGTEQFNVLQKIADKSKMGDVVQWYDPQIGSFVAIRTPNSVRAIYPGRVLDNANLGAVKSVLKETGYDPAIKYSMLGSKDPLGGGAPVYTPAMAVLDESLLKTNKDISQKTWKQLITNNSGDKGNVRIIANERQVAGFSTKTEEQAIQAAKSYLEEHPKYNFAEINGKKYARNELFQSPSQLNVAQAPKSNITPQMAREALMGKESQLALPEGNLTNYVPNWMTPNAYQLPEIAGQSRYSYQPPIDIKKMTSAYDVEKAMGMEPTMPGVRFQKQDATGASRYQQWSRSVFNKASDLVGKGLVSDNPIVRNLARLVQGFYGGAGKSDQYVGRLGKLRSDYGDYLAYQVNRYVNGIVDGNKESLSRVWSILDPQRAKELGMRTLKEADLSDTEKESLSFLRLVSDFINDTNYKNNLISEKMWREARGGKYLMRGYDFKIPKEMENYYKHTLNLMDMSPFIKRQEKVAKEVLETTITDPAALVSMRLRQLMRNDQMIQFGKWAKDTDLVSDIKKEGMVQLTKNKLWGELSGKWVRKDVVDDIGGLHFNNKIADSLYSIIDVINRKDHPYGKLKALYKEIRTVFSPAVQVGNKTGNHVFGYLNGINPNDFIAGQQAAKRQIKNGDALYRRAIKDGIIGAEVERPDLVRLVQQFADETGNKSLVTRYLDWARKSYGQTDNIAKLAALNAHIKNGKTYEEAAKLVVDGFQSYRTVGWLYDISSKLPIFGKPFAKFSAELSKIIVSSLRDHPLRAISALTLMKVITDAGSALSQETPEQRRVRESRVGAKKIPLTNVSLNVQTPWGEVDVSRLVGISDVIEPKGQGLGGIETFAPFEAPTDMEEIKKMLSNDMVIGPALAVWADTDFRGRSIADPLSSKYTGPLASNQEQWLNRTKYLLYSYADSNSQSLYNLVMSFMGKEGFYGQKRTVPQSLLRMYPGIKVEQMTPEVIQNLVERSQYFDANEIQKIDSKISQDAKLLSQGKITQAQYESRVAQENAKRVELLGGMKTSVSKYTEQNAKVIKEKMDNGIDVSSEEAGMYFFGSYNELPQSNAVEKAIVADKYRSRLNQIIESAALTKENKDYLTAMIAEKSGVTPAEMQYYYLAGKEAPVKMAFYLERLGSEDKSKWLDILATGREEVLNKQLLTNGMIDDLVDDGIISYEDGKFLKKIKTKKGKQVISKSGSAKRVKLKVSKPKQVKIASGSYKPKKIKLQGSGKSYTVSKPKFKAIKANI